MDNIILVAVNLDPSTTNESTVHLPIRELNLGDQAFGVDDLITGERFRWKGEQNYVKLSVEQAVHIPRVERPW